jgi:hypothetical protein
MKLGDPRLPLLGSVAANDVKSWASILLNRLYDLFRKTDAALDATYQHYFLTPTALTHTVGTTTSVLSDMTAFDANAYTVTEVAAAPAIDFELTFTGVRRVRFIAARARYAGSATHATRVQLYNYLTAAYDSFDAFNLAQAYEYHFIPVQDDAPYINASKEARVRFYHTETGNASHQFFVDYVAIVE